MEIPSSSAASISEYCDFPALVNCITCSLPLGVSTSCIVESRATHPNQGERLIAERYRLRYLGTRGGKSLSEPLRFMEIGSLVHFAHVVRWIRPGEWGLHFGLIPKMGWHGCRGRTSIGRWARLRSRSRISFVGGISGKLAAVLHD